MAAELAEDTLDQDLRQAAVRRMLDRSFGREEDAVIKTQRLDAAPGSPGAPDRAYHRIGDGAMARALCGRVLEGAELDAVVAHWTARGIAAERQEQHRRQVVDEGRSEEGLRFRPLSAREWGLWRAKDEACLRLNRPIIAGLGRRQPPPPDLVLDLIREWAGLIDAGQRARLADAYRTRSVRATRHLKSGRRDRGQVGVHQLLEDLHARALDRLAAELTPEDVMG